MRDGAEGSHQLDRADARRLSVARHPVRSASLRRSQTRALAAAGRPAPPQHQYPQPVCRQRRPPVDRHTAGAGKLEGRDADHHPEVPGQVGSMLEDRDGTVWAGARAPAGSCAPSAAWRAVLRRQGGVRRPGQLGIRGPRRQPLGRVRDRIMAVETWPVGARIRDFELARHCRDGGGCCSSPSETSSGSSLAKGSFEYHLLDQPLEHPVRAHAPGSRWRPVDRHLRPRPHSRPSGQVDLFSRADGLSSNYVRGLFEDREGNIWVATDNGLDRFRHTAVTTISANHGLSEGTPWSVLPASDGSVWVGTVSGLNRLRTGGSRRTAGRANRSRKILPDQPAAW